MGGDGGVKATQRRFMRGTLAYTEERMEGINGRDQRGRRTRYCAQSGGLLVEPIVACEMGNLYNKDELISALLRKTLHDKFSHIRGLKDVKTLVLTPNPVASEDSPDTPKYVCPVTMAEFNGILPFVFIWTTGHVMSEKALKTIGIDGLQAEYGPFVQSDVIRLIPLEEEIEEQFQQLLHKRSMTGGKEKKSSRKIHREDNDAAEGVSKRKRSLAGGSSGVCAVRLNSAADAVRVADETVLRQQASSGVYKGLFHADKETDKDARDLFSGVAGLRYSVR